MGPARSITDRRKLQQNVEGPRDSRFYPPWQVPLRPSKSHGWDKHSGPPGLVRRESDAPHGEELTEGRTGNVPGSFNHHSVTTVTIQHLITVHRD